MESYVIHDAPLDHDGGAHNLEVEIEGDQAVIRFGASFTLRMNESQVDRFREIIHDTARELCINRRDTTGVWSVSDQEVNAENEMIQAGIDAREKLKQKKRETFNPNDPVNW
jgi:hypothetical protein